MNKEYKALWQLISIIYSAIVVSIGLSTTIYFAVSASTTGHVAFHEVFFSGLYAVGTVAIAVMFWHVRRSLSTPTATNDLPASPRQQKDTADVPVEADDGGDGANNGDKLQPAPEVSSVTDQQVPEVALIGEGFNVYLRIGLAVFLAGCLALNLLQCVVHLFVSGTNCRRATALIMNVLEAVFTASQGVYILMNHRVVFLRRKAQARMALAHLVTANACIWASAAIGEIKEQLGESTEATEHNATSTTVEKSENSCEASWRVVEEAKPFLTPAVIEYCLLAAPMALHLLACVGDHEAFEERARRPSGAGAEATGTNWPSLLRRAFAKSRRGLAFSVVAFVATAAVTVVVYLVLDAEAASKAYLVQDILLSAAGLVLSGFVCSRLRCLRLSKGERHSFDDKLLIFALFGALVYLVVLLLATVDHAEMFPRAYLAAELISLLLCIVQLPVQAFCLLDGLRRRVRSLAEAEAKPGRGLVLALLGVNLSMWIMETFEVRKAEEMLMSYGMSKVSNSALEIIIHIGQPINIFYRFHSTVCLSIIWLTAYKWEPHESKTSLVEAEA